MLYFVDVLLIHNVFNVNIQYFPRMLTVELTRLSIERYDKRGISGILRRSFEINSKQEALRRCARPYPTAFRKHTGAV